MDDASTALSALTHWDPPPPGKAQSSDNEDTALWEDAAIQTIN